MLDYQSLTHSLIVAAVLFALGVVGFITRRNLVTVVISAFIMLQGVVLAFTAFSRFHANDAGQIFAVFTIGTTFVQVALVLSIMIALARVTGFVDLSRWKFPGAQTPDDGVPTTNLGRTEPSDQSRGAGD